MGHRVWSCVLKLVGSAAQGPLKEQIHVRIAQLFRATTCHMGSGLVDYLVETYLRTVIGMRLCVYFGTGVPGNK